MIRLPLDERSARILATALGGVAVRSWLALPPFGTGWVVQTRRGVHGPRCEKWIIIALDGRHVLHDGMREAPPRT